MLYFDTSFLVPLILPEATSEVIADFLAPPPAGELVVSHWTRVEFASLLGREVRIGRRLGLPTDTGIRLSGYDD